MPPYLDPNLGINELISGVSFASAGSGYDPLTPTITVSVRSQSLFSVFKFLHKQERRKNYIYASGSLFYYYYNYITANGTSKYLCSNIMIVS